MPTEQEIREAAPDLVRFMVGEALGYRYYWYDYLGECYMRDLGEQNTNAMTTLTGRPGDDAVNMEFVPDWPNDIAAALKLANDIQAEWDTWPHTDRFHLYWQFVTLGHGLWSAQVRTADCSESRPWIMPVHAANLAEAICRVWLIAKFAFAATDDKGI